MWDMCIFWHTRVNMLWHFVLFCVFFFFCKTVGSQSTDNLHFEKYCSLYLWFVSYAAFVCKSKSLFLFSSGLELSFKKFSKISYSSKCSYRYITYCGRLDIVCIFASNLKKKKSFKKKCNRLPLHLMLILYFPENY